jgi:hypothetical protein
LQKKTLKKRRSDEVVLKKFKLNSVNDLKLRSEQIKDERKIKENLSRFKQIQVDPSKTERI